MTLTEQQADEIETEMRALEADPLTTLRAMRLFMQSPMPCGHAAGNLLTCPDPPFGCVACIEDAEIERALAHAGIALRPTSLRDRVWQLVAAYGEVKARHETAHAAWERDVKR